jgi:hypothetical protein
MPEGLPTTLLVLEVVQAVALAALQEEQQLFTRGDFPVHGPNFLRLSSNALDEGQLTRLKDEGIAATHGRCIKLPIQQKDGIWWAALLWITPKKQGQEDCDQLLQVVLGGTDERPFGFRFEPPEGDGGGLHDYWHAQPIAAVRTIHNTEVELGIPRGATCTHAPAFPLHVEDRLSLMDALLVSLYGPSYLEKYVEDASLRERIRREVKRGWQPSLGRAASPRAGTQRQDSVRRR